MTEWIVRRWARYGHKRLYAETPGGTALGYQDLKTGRYHCDELSNLPLLEKAIADHLAATQSDTDAASAVEAASEPPVVADGSDAPPPLPQPPNWVDISGSPAGSAAREQAIAAREAQGRLKHFLSRVFDVRTDERAWRVGADGEQAVAAQLAKLGAEWRLIHAIRVGDRGSDIDHLVIGPSGVFTVNAKHHPRASIWVGGDTFMVNGHRVPYIRNSRHEARRAGKLLTEHAGFPVTVTGLIAVMGATKGFTIKKQPEDGAVVVVQRRRVGHHVQQCPTVLRTGEIDAIYEIARRSTTWH